MPPLPLVTLALGVLMLVAILVLARAQAEVVDEAPLPTRAKAQPLAAATLRHPYAPRVKRRWLHQWAAYGAPLARARSCSRQPLRCDAMGTPSSSNAAAAKRSSSQASSEDRAATL